MVVTVAAAAAAVRCARSTTRLPPPFGERPFLVRPKTPNRRFSCVTNNCKVKTALPSIMAQKPKMAITSNLVVLISRMVWWMVE